MSNNNIEENKIQSDKVTYNTSPASHKDLNDVILPKETKHSNSIKVQLDIITENACEDLNEIPPRKRNTIFIIFLLSNLFLNYDTGVIPASLTELTKEITLDYKEVALIGSLIYLGLSFASLFVSTLFNKYGPAKICAFMLLLNSVCCFLFSFNYNKYILYCTRFLMGASEAFIVVYAPVWVNNYSPSELSTTWMGILHAFTAIGKLNIDLGVIMGYMTAGITINFFSKYLSWRFAVRIQGIAEIPLALYFLYEDPDNINVPLSQDKSQRSFISDDVNNEQISPSHFQGTRKKKSELEIKVDNSQITNRSRQKNKKMDSRIDAVEMENLNSYFYQSKVILSNEIYVFVCLGLCSMFFIVTGIQFWITIYLIDYLGNDPFQTVVMFSIISITAPLAGVIVGGTFADRYGGYKGKNVIKALKLCCAFGLVSFVFAFPIGFLYSIVYVSVLLWAFLFFGAAVVPVGTGIMVSSVKRYKINKLREFQSTSSSLSQIIFNLLGYFSSPILTGIIIDQFKDKNQGYKWGMRLILWWSIFAVIFIGLALIFAYRKYKIAKQEKEENDLVDPMNQNMVDLVKLEVMRRIAQGSSGF